VDGDKITGHELKEPFDVLSEAYHVYQSSRASKTYHRRDPAPKTANSAALANEYGAVNRDTLIDSQVLDALGFEVSPFGLGGAWIVTGRRAGWEGMAEARQPLVSATVDSR